MLTILAGCSGAEGAPGGSTSGDTGGTASAGTGGGTGTPSGGGASPTAGASAGGTAGAGGSPVVMGGSAGQGGAPPIGGGSGDSGAHVVTWVPPYRVTEAKQQLAASFDGATMADGLSFLALQFWITDGPATYLDQVSESDISWFHDWARQHGVKILLCVNNNTGGDWNWPEAVRSFKDNRDAFAAHLVSEMTARDFDGVDLDLEGIIEATADDQESYRLFVETISNLLHPMGKVLTLDSFHGQWNAPNWNWWPDLFPHVDGITSMGYDQSGLALDYQDLVDHAAAAPQKLMIGVPSYQGSWQGNSVGEQLDWIIQQGQIGTAIWDASLMAVEWQQRSVWDQLKNIKSR